LLADLHGISCSLKSFASTITAEGIETCRRAMGGHGFSSFSGLVTWYTDYLPTVTWDGDNYVLTQQAAKYLLKSARSMLQGGKACNQITQIFACFLQDQPRSNPLNIQSSDEDIVSAFARRTSFLAFKALKRHDEEKVSWNNLLVDFQRLSAAYSQYLVVEDFYNTLQSPQLSSEVNSLTVELMRKLYRLFAWDLLEKAGMEFQECEAIQLGEILHIREKSIISLLEDIRPHSVCLVDIWNFPDWQLDSSLGRKDGMVYEDLFHRASQLNPLNNLTVDPNPNSEVLIRKEKRAASKL